MRRLELFFCKGERDSMPQVKLKTGRAGIGFVNDPGDVIEVSEKEAETLVRTGQAEYVKDDPEEPEKPAAPAPKRRGRPPKKKPAEGSGDGGSETEDSSS